MVRQFPSNTEMPRSQLNFRIDLELLKAIQKAAEAEKKPVSHWILDACKEKLGQSHPLTVQESASVLSKVDRLSEEVELLKEELELLRQRLEAQEAKQSVQRKVPSWEEVVAADKALATMLGLGSDLENFELGDDGSQKPVQQLEEQISDSERWLQLREHFSSLTKRNLLSELTKRGISHRDSDGLQRTKGEIIDILSELEMDNSY